MSRASLIKLIHVARRNLQLDDDTYRSVLYRVTGKQSCRDLKVGQLEDVLKVLEDKGFRRTRPRSPARRHRETDITARFAASGGRCILMGLSVMAAIPHWIRSSRR